MIGPIFLGVVVVIAVAMRHHHKRKRGDHDRDDDRLKIVFTEKHKMAVQLINPGADLDISFQVLNEDGTPNTNVTLANPAMTMTPNDGSFGTLNTDAATADPNDFELIASKASGTTAHFDGTVDVTFTDTGITRSMEGVADAQIAQPADPNAKDSLVLTFTVKPAA